MPLPTIRAYAFFWRDKKAATVNQTNVRVLPGRNALFGADGYYAHSKGAVQVQIEISEVVPVAGTATLNDLEQFIVAQRDIDVAVLVGGKMIRVTMACTEASFESDTESGRATGKITLQGGIPKVTG